jgi:hypothetical protein
MRIRTLAGLAAGVLALLAGTLGAPTADAVPAWAPAASATIHPGVQMITAGSQCTANFVFSDGGSTYLGYAAHCAGTGGATETDGCLAGSLPLGTAVEIDGASRPGTLAYSSWLAMQNAGETDPDACAYNDLALVRLDPADVANVNPSIPVWGGPTSLDGNGTSTGERVYTYGNSSLRLGLTALSPHTGISLGTQGNGWSHPTYTVLPGIPGDSGSALLSSTGQAVGVLSTLAIAPLAGSNNYGDLSHELAYMHSHGLGATLVPGTEPFNPNAIPIG